MMATRAVDVVVWDVVEEFEMEEVRKDLAD